MTDEEWKEKEVTSQCKQFFHDFDSLNMTGTVVPLANSLKLLGVVLDANPPLTRISSRQDRTARRRRGEGDG